MIPGNYPTAQMRGAVDDLARPYSVHRRVGRDESAVGAPVKYEQDVASVRLYLYRRNGGESSAEMGPVQQGQMRGVCDGDADIRVGDRVDSGARRYEVVEPIRSLPDPTNTVIKELTLERVADQDANYVHDD